MPEYHTPETLEERLREVIGDELPYAWAKRIGLGKSTLAGILQNKACPRTSTLIKIALNTNISINWLLTGKGSRYVFDAQNSYLGNQETMVRDQETPYIVSPQSLVYVPRFNITLKGKEGESFHSGQVVDYLVFKSDWVTGTMGLDKDQIALVTIIGDSMEPTLKEGDLVLLDQREQTVNNDGIYVMRIGDALVAKRLQRGFDGSVTIKNDKETYKDDKITQEQAEHLCIFGRVVWTGGRV